MERRSEIITLDHAQVSRLVDEARPRTAVLAFELLAGGKANTNYRVETENGTVVLRLYTRAAYARDKEAALLAMLDDVPVPRVLGTTEFDSVPASVLEFLPGKPLDIACEAFGEPEWTTAGRTIGQALARIHARKFDKPGDLKAQDGKLIVAPWEFGDGGGFIDHCLDETPAGERLGPARCEELRRRVKQVERGLPALENPPTLTHSDFNPTNLLVDERGALMAVLDWEFAHAGEPLMDLGNLLRDNPDRNPTPPPAFVDAMVAELELPDDWRIRARLIDLSSALEFLSSKEDKPQTHRQALSQVDAFLTDAL